jgi:hypothetical protein
MATCDWCGEQFRPATTWQRFCKTKCSDSWHYNEKKQDGRIVLARERQQELRMNGEGTDEQRAEAKARLVEMFKRPGPEPKIRRF